MDDLSDLLIFADFAKKHSSDYEKKFQFIIYAIGSPMLTPKTWYITSQYQIPLYILVREPTNEGSQYSLIAHYVPFETITKVFVGDEILASGKTVSLTNYQNFKYQPIKQKGFISKKIYTITRKKLSNPIKLTLTDLITRYGFFHKTPHALCESDAHDEWFYLFETDQSAIIISAIEIIRYFYLSSPGHSLVNHILDPAGINHLYTNITATKINSEGKSYPHFQIDIYAHSKMNDVNKIFFFSHAKKYRHYFSSVEHIFSKTKKFDALIPTARTLKIYAEGYKQGNYLLITKIHESNIAAHMQSWIVDYTHPKSNPHTIDPTPKPFQDLQQADASNIVSEVQYANKNLKPKRVKDESQYFGEGKLENPKFPLGPTFTHLPNKEEKKRSKSNKIPQHLGERDLSLSGHTVNKDGPIAIEVHTKMDKHQKKKHEAQSDAQTHEKHSLHNQDISTKYIDQLVEEFMKHGYAVKETFKSVEKPYSSKTIERKAIKFYVEILLEKEDMRFIYIDVLAKKYPSSAQVYDDKKEVLLVKYDMNFKDHYIREFVYDQLDEGNHKWGTKSPYKELFVYGTMRHRQGLKSFVESILDKLIIM